MKTQRKTRTSPHHSETRNLTLGDLIAATYGAAGDQGAPKILQLALEANLIRFASRP